MFGSVNISVVFAGVQSLPVKLAKQHHKHIYVVLPRHFTLVNERKARSTDLPDEIASSPSRGFSTPLKLSLCSTVHRISATWLPPTPNYTSAPQEEYSVIADVPSLQPEVL